MRLGSSGRDLESGRRAPRSPSSGCPGEPNAKLTGSCALPASRPSAGLSGAARYRSRRRAHHAGVPQAQATDRLRPAAKRLCQSDRGPARAPRPGHLEARLTTACPPQLRCRFYRHSPQATTAPKPRHRRPPRANPLFRAPRKRQETPERPQPAPGRTGGYDEVAIGHDLQGERVAQASAADPAATASAARPRPPARSRCSPRRPGQPCLPPDLLTTRLATTGAGARPGWEEAISRRRPLPPCGPTPR